MNSKTAYLDIETSYQGNITVIGVHFPSAGTQQLVGAQVSVINLLDLLGNAEIIKTYNGDRFDLPVIKQQLGLDLKSIFLHQDIMYLCWKHQLKGGLKAVEQRLGLVRETEGIDGMQAMALWAAWEETGDRRSLELLLKYNREDIENLVQIEKRLLAKEGEVLSKPVLES